MREVFPDGSRLEELAIDVRLIGQGMRTGSAVRICLKPNRAERAAMIILLHTFLTLFLAVFSLGLVMIHRLEQTKGIAARAESRTGRMEGEKDAAWRRRRQSLLG